MSTKKVTRTRAKKRTPATQVPAVLGHNAHPVQGFHIRRTGPEDPHASLGYPYFWTHEGSEFRRYAATDIDCHAAILTYLGDAVEETQ